MQRPSRSPRLAWAYLVAAAVLAVACGDDEGGIPPASRPDGPSTASTTVATTTTTEARQSTSTSTTAADPEHQLIIDRYLAFWDARFAANEEPVDPESPALAEYATGAQLDTVRAETARNATEGLALRRPSPSITRRAPTVISVSGDTAQLQDCAVNDGIVYRVATGEVVDDSVVTRNVSAVMRLIEGEWRLEAARIIQEWEGVAGCALA